MPERLTKEQAAAVDGWAMCYDGNPRADPRVQKALRRIDETCGPVPNGCGIEHLALTVSAMRVLDLLARAEQAEKDAEALDAQILDHYAAGYSMHRTKGNPAATEMSIDVLAAGVRARSRHEARAIRAATESSGAPSRAGGGA